MEHAMGNPTPAGVRVVVLDTILASLPIAEADLGLPWNWRVGPAARAVSDASYAALGFTPTGRGLVPFAPVHVEQPWRTARNPRDLTLRWTRRSRALVADAWDPVGVPEDVSDAIFSLVNDADPTKKALFSPSGITPGTTRTYTLPNTSRELVILAGTQTSTCNKTFTGTLTASGTVTVSAASARIGTATTSATHGMGTGATTTGVTKPVNIGTGGPCASARQSEAWLRRGKLVEARHAFDAEPPDRKPGVMRGEIRRDALVKRQRVHRDRGRRALFQQHLHRLEVKARVMLRRAVEVAEALGVDPGCPA
jgi:hypothetical protein